MTNKTKLPEGIISINPDKIDFGNKEVKLVFQSY